MRRDDLLLRMTAPLKRVEQPNERIERWVQTPLSSDDHTSLAQACQLSGQRIGAFYHWYFQKLLVSRRVKSLDKRGMEALIERFDRTDYAPLDRTLASPGGVLAAIPHHGHYILSIIALARQAAKRRRVMIFYGDPATHAGNEVFDHLYRVLFGDPACGVEVIHDTRAGMVKAIRGLQSGALVIIMPDVHKREMDSYQVPFCDRLLNVMLGTAVLARKTGSTVLPVVSRPQGASFGFRNAWGPLLTAESAAMDELGELQGDYTLTASMFQYFDRVMRPEILYWQYVRQLFMSDDRFPVLDAATAEDVVSLVLQGPTCNLQLDRVLELDAQEAGAEV